MPPSGTDLQRLRFSFEQAILALDRVGARRIATASTASWSAFDVADELVTPVLARLGTGWDEGRVALSQIYIGARICEELLDAALPGAHPDRRSRPRMAVAVLEDHHTLGKRIVYAALRAAGYDLTDYGHATVAELAAKAAADGIEILLVSTLMLSSALKVVDLRTRLADAGSRARIVVGGAPYLFDDHLWLEVGADATARSAAGVIPVVRKLAGELGVSA